MTLIELLVAMVLSLIVFGAATGVMIVSFHAQSNASTRAGKTATASAMLDRVTREIRQATTTPSPGITVTAATIENAAGTPATTGGKLVLETPVNTSSTGLGTPQQVVYDCTLTSTAPGDVPGSNKCNRTVGVRTTTVITGISNGTSVFSASQSTNPTFINVTLDMALGRPFAHPVEIKDGVELRNLGP